ncbi:Peroxisome biogenesis factor 10 [Artemisia annua]|uniref:RING-type E3 ubiquitin transferase n=1 Tax=Artemisia annua TaxID=35608 RepID=A0A2U1PDG4_ARTAN|nr:Peroxisome biogenesis factor 10 [Artemisia annua]
MWACHQFQLDVFGHFHVRTKMYLDGAILKEEMDPSADVLAAGLLEVSDPSLSVKFFNQQVLPLAREFLQLLLRANLMFFYFEGLYYHILKRSVGIRDLFIGKPMNQRPRYQMLGMFLLVQLCNIAAEGLRRSNLASIIV